MQSLNAKVVRQVSVWLAQGESVYLSTVIQTWGASPRPPGSLLAYNAIRNQQIGSLSGGCIEADLISSFQNNTTSQTYPFIKEYGRKSGESELYNLPCGGVMQLVVEALIPSSETANSYEILSNDLSARSAALRHVDMDSGVTSCININELSQEGEISPVLLEEQSLIHKLSPEYRLLIVGIGEIAGYLASFAEAAEFEVTVCDPREDFIERSRELTKQFDVKHCLPDDLVNDHFSDKYCAIVALAHDPRVDDLALMAGLDSDAFYVGAMGSRLTTDKRLARLREVGIEDDLLSKLHAPIGLSIQSKTPPEIAVSILAQIIQSKHRAATAG